MLRPWTRSRSSRPRSCGRWPALAGSRSCISSPPGQCEAAAWRSDGHQPAERLTASRGAAGGGSRRGRPRRSRSPLSLGGSGRDGRVRPIMRARPRANGCRTSWHELSSGPDLGSNDCRLQATSVSRRHGTEVIHGEPLNLVLFSGTDDKLQAAAVLTAGAAALGKPVNIFLQYWALDAFRADRIDLDHGLALRPDPTAGSPSMRSRARVRPAGPRPCARPRTSGRSTSRRARCRWTCSISKRVDLDPLVDGVEGVTSF